MSATTALPSVGAPGLRVPWRAIEWVGAVVCLFLMSGAVLPLALMASAGELGPAQRAVLRATQVPMLAFGGLLVLRFPGAALLAARRTLPLTALVLLAVASVTWSVAPGFTGRRAVALLGTMGVAYGIAIRFTPRQMLVLFAVVLGPCLGASLLAAVAMPGLSWMPDGTGLRGVYTHKNVLGWAASLAVAVSMGLLSDANRRMRRAGAGLLLLALGCLIPSGSSTGLLAAATAMVLTAVHAVLARTGGTARTVVVLLILQAAALLLLSLGWLLVPLLEHLGRDATLTGRVPLWVAIDVHIRERPWLGFGYGAFWSDGNYRALAIYDRLGWVPPHGHNGYRDMLLSLGAVGGALLGLALATGVRGAARLNRARPGEGWGWINAAIGMMLLMNLSETNFLAQVDIQWAFLATALIAVGLNRAEAPDRRSTAAGWAPAGAPPVHRDEAPSPNG